VRILVVGTSYVGLPTGAVLASKGHSVTCVDLNETKIALLKAGGCPLYEPGLAELLDAGRASECLTFSTELESGADVVIIAVGTPEGEDGYPNLSQVDSVARSLAPLIHQYTVIVNKSTVPVGTVDRVSEILTEAGADPSLFDVASSPEFLREGTAVNDTLNPDRVVIGCESARAIDILKTLYADFQTNFFITDPRSAELIKYASNSFLAMKISYINAMSRLCERFGADVGAVAKGMGMDPRIGEKFLGAGLGWGGGCFPKDVQGLLQIAKKVDYDFGLLREVWNVNESQTENFLERMEVSIGGFAGKQIGLLGLAFKPNTDDIRKAKSLEIIARIVQNGGSVVAYDPAAAESVQQEFPQIQIVATPYEVSSGSDAIVLVTEWEEFKNLDLKKLAEGMKTRLFYDGRRIIDREAAKAAGFRYFTVGNRGE
jgi:UDPglucose 6-dehydrogenase